MIKLNNYKKLQEVPFTDVSIKDKFWAPKMKVNKETTIEVCLEQCEKTGRISNFAKAAGLMEGEFEGLLYNDSDVYKVIEGIAYSLMNNPDDKLETRTDDIIDKIAAAQQPDGYINTYFTLAAPDRKWTDMGNHETYCGGHLIEAAIAYKKATGKDKLLKVAIKFVDLLDSLFGEGKHNWVTGHQEVELALVKLYKETGEKRYLNLAHWFLEQRGRGLGVGRLWKNKDFGVSYYQDDKPVSEIERVNGHAVRAMYMYSAMADIASLNKEDKYLEALNRVWDNVALKNMYITGGIGPSHKNEGFTEDYDLPNDTAYCETCASVGMVLWNYRMNMLNPDGKYIDVLERAMYNGALAGVSIEGNKFFYVNPLKSDGSHHRQEWYSCSCCPTQVSRFIPSIGNYIYNTSEEGIWVNLYVESESIIKLRDKSAKLFQYTEYPWKGRVDFTIELSDIFEFEINLRLPGWCSSAEVKINNLPVHNFSIDRGYIKLYKAWNNGDKITLELDMPVRRVYSNPQVKENTGRAAITRGPLVYCLEQQDNKLDLKDINLHEETEYFIENIPELLGGVTVIKILNKDSDDILTAVPYFAWDNRQSGPMEVWLKEQQKEIYLYSYK